MSAQTDAEPMQLASTTAPFTKACTVLHTSDCLEILAVCRATCRLTSAHEVTDSLLPQLTFGDRKTVTCLGASCSTAMQQCMMLQFEMDV